MEINDYFDEIKEVIDRYSTTHFVFDANVNFDTRSGEQGYLKAIIYFTDNSSLHVKEFIDLLDESIEKLMYVYHYQNSGNQLIFRYDNALHKPALPFLQHKHIPEQIIEAAAPKLTEVFEEIFTIKKWA